VGAPPTLWCGENTQRVWDYPPVVTHQRPRLKFPPPLWLMSPLKGGAPPPGDKMGAHTGHPHAGGSENFISPTKGPQTWARPKPRATPCPTPLNTRRVTQQKEIVELQPKGEKFPPPQGRKKKGVAKNPNPKGPPLEFPQGNPPISERFPLWRKSPSQWKQWKTGWEHPQRNGYQGNRWGP